MFDSFFLCTSFFPKIGNISFLNKTLQNTFPGTALLHDILHVTLRFNQHCGSMINSTCSCSYSHNACQIKQSSIGRRLIWFSQAICDGFIGARTHVNILHFINWRLSFVTCSHQLPPNAKANFVSEAIFLCYCNSFKLHLRNQWLTITL